MERQGGSILIPNYDFLKVRAGDEVFDFLYNVNLQTPQDRYFRAIGGQPNVSRAPPINVPASWTGDVVQSLMTLDTLGFDVALGFRVRRTSGQAMTLTVNRDATQLFSATFKYPSSDLNELLILTDIPAGTHTFGLRITGGRGAIECR